MAAMHVRLCREGGAKFMRPTIWARHIRVGPERAVGGDHRRIVSGILSRPVEVEPDRE